MSACRSGSMPSIVAALSAGIAVNAKGYTGCDFGPMTALDAAVMGHHRPVIAHLLSVGAVPEGEAIMEEALLSLQADIIDMLLGAGGNVNPRPTGTAGAQRDAVTGTGKIAQSLLFQLLDHLDRDSSRESSEYDSDDDEETFVAWARLGETLEPLTKLDTSMAVKVFEVVLKYPSVDLKVKRYWDSGETLVKAAKRMKLKGIASMIAVEVYAALGRNSDSTSSRSHEL